ncbi:MAG: tRNA uridine-5-carboxymethylaminomethyl(34) synthesis GTPase MnmE [Ruminococcaceae bacterium]|nr:tRNA uridine-5-carboxymethylaminomethyl(34) synthesis GTPase MnmE [Oscillospiraceae bacterium]
MSHETIAAIATPVGVGGIGVIRISGDKAFFIADKIFKGKTNLCDAHSHTIHYGHIINENGETIDEVMVSVMRAPRTFTAEDTVEISTHGSPLIMQKVLSATLSAGARMATAGEFTRRAFLNGRIDLSSAEAVIDVIHADSDLSLKNAINQLEGGLLNEIEKIREPLLYVSAQFAAAVDYPDDEIADLSEESLEKTLKDALDKCEKLIDGADVGRIVKEGIICVLAGRPNVGKSSLLNALTMSERAIVTDIAGTTRDVIEQSVTINGVAIRLFDTAGIRAAGDEAEKIGVDRSKGCIEGADIVLVLFDSGEAISEEDIEILSLTKDKKRIIVINKSDLEQKLDISGLADAIKDDKLVYISTKTHDGIDELKQIIADVCSLKMATKSSSLVSNMRHSEALKSAKSSLAGALDTLKSGMPMDMCTIDVSAALESLGLITGQGVSADIVDEIFARFCVGK